MRGGTHYRGMERQSGEGLEVGGRRSQTGGTESERLQGEKAKGEERETAAIAAKSRSIEISAGIA